MNPAEPNDGKPRANRAKVVLVCEIRQGTRPWKEAKLEDLSETGFRIGWLPNCRMDTPLRIRIPGMQLLSAHIRWQDQGSVGCQFTEPLHPAVFDHIARSARNA